MPPGRDVKAWIARRRAAGFGEGAGASYKPWLSVRSVPSHGRVFRVAGRHGRTYQLLSTREYRCFLLLEWSDLVTDVREQFPLHDLEETQTIARALGVRHPAYGRRVDGQWVRRAEPLTTDFLVSLADHSGLPARLAISVKTASSLEDTARKIDRLLEKAEIERRYWASREVPFRVVTDHELPKTLLDNLDLVLPYRLLDGFPIAESRVSALLEQLIEDLVAAADTPLATTCAAVDSRLRMEAGSALVLVWHAIATKKWHVDLAQPLRADRPLAGLCARALRESSPAPALL